MVMAKKRNALNNKQRTTATKQTSLLSFWGRPPSDNFNRDLPRTVEVSQELLSTPKSGNSLLKGSKQIIPDSTTFAAQTEHPRDLRDVSRLSTPAREMVQLSFITPLTTSTEQRIVEHLQTEPKSRNDMVESVKTNAPFTASRVKRQSYIQSGEITNDESNGNDPPISEYEKLRQRNIERNNARLAALGLLPNGFHAQNKRMQNLSDHRLVRRTKKRSASRVANEPRSQPMRRSSRHHKSVMTQDPSAESVLKNENIENHHHWTNKKLEHVVEPIEFTHSPLYHYHASTKSTKDISSKKNHHYVDFSQMTTLEVVGPRCVPPKGLTALYSLQFWDDGSSNSSWLVGAGKAGMIALWSLFQHHAKCIEDDTSTTTEIEPVMSWKAHNGRWVADAKLLRGHSNNDLKAPLHLVSAGNDGTVCLWDLAQMNNASGTPRMLFRSVKELHTSGIFCMDIQHNHSNNNPSHTLICTGSKDKTIAVSAMDSTGKEDNVVLWRSHFHNSKVGAVRWKGDNSTILVSASDDGLVAIHDYRMNGSNNASTSVVAQLNGAHARPHSAVWRPEHDHLFATAGLDPAIKLWDNRHLATPVACLEGHVPKDRRFKAIHRPIFVHSFGKTNQAAPTKGNVLSYLLTGGEGSGCLSTYLINNNGAHDDESTLSYHNLRLETNLLSRGSLPDGDAGCITVQNNLVAVSSDQGGVILMRPVNITRGTT